MIKPNLLATSSIGAIGAFLLAPTAAIAQTPPSLAAAAPGDAPSDGNAIVVTGSRISVVGYQAPTPVSVVSEAQLTRDAKSTIGDSIRELPAVGASSSSANNNAGSGGIVAGTSGLDTVNLRQLGVTRTLVLLDGQRVVASNINGAVDLGTIPSQLVKRVDVVTGGASAAYGSDAVAGVVNLVLDKTFTGLKASADYSDTSNWDHKQYRFQAAFGQGFDDDRGHILVAGTFLNSPETVFANQRSWNRYTALLTNPTYTANKTGPQYIHADYIGNNLATTGSIITAGPLAGIYFTGSNATPAVFNYGLKDGQLSANGSQEQFLQSFSNLNSQFKQYTIFTHARYEFAPWARLSVQGNFGRTDSLNSSVPLYKAGNVTIRVDNAYLPQTIKDQMIARGLTTLTIGTTNLNNIPMDLTKRYSMEALENTVGIPVAFLRRVLNRGVVTLDGDLGGGWSYNAYYQRSQIHFYQETINNQINANFTNAVDAVVGPTGAIVCRSTLTAPTNGCAPLNIFGYGNASQAAIDYINVKPGQNWTNQHLTQEVYAVSAQGALPFGLPAGPIAVAAGAEHRMEHVNVVVDPGAQARAYGQGNFANMDGRYNVKEAFLEFEVPLLRDSFIKEASLNAAGRITDYSTSGTVKTWKVGLTATIVSDVRLRGTISRDIRAPIVNELFSQGVATTGSAIDPKSGKSVFIYTFASGNPNLKPEVAKTYTAGIILAPHWVPRLQLSLDYYNIKINGAITSIGASTVLARCNAGEKAFCTQLVFGGAAGELSQINTYPLNVANLKTSGLDFQGNYSMPLFNGQLSSRFVGNYMFEESQLQLGTLVNYAGALGSNNGTTGLPRFRGSFSTTYDQGDWSLTAQVRMLGAAKLVYTWKSGVDVDNNRIKPIAYLDLRASRKIAGNFELFFNVDNVLGQAPPVIPATVSQGENAYYGVATSGTIYDLMGRTYRAGVRARF